MNEIILKLKDKDDKAAMSIQKYLEPKDGQIADVFDRMSTLLYDSKHTIVRQCLRALHD